METLLVQKDLLNTSVFENTCSTLKDCKVSIFSGPALAKELTFGPPPAAKLKHEYGGLACAIEVPSFAPLRVPNLVLVYESTE